MTPVELVEKALREHLRLRLGKRALTDAMMDKPIPLSGREAEDAARIALDALAGAGLVVVPAADIVLALAHPAQLTKAREFNAHMNAKDALLAVARPVVEALPAALPERNETP